MMLMRGHAGCLVSNSLSVFSFGVGGRTACGIGFNVSGIGSGVIA